MALASSFPECEEETGRRPGTEIQRERALWQKVNKRGI